jgi:hypothetical protein
MFLISVEEGRIESFVACRFSRGMSTLSVTALGFVKVGPAKEFEMSREADARALARKLVAFV